MKTFLSVVAVFLLGLTAPIVCIVYRGGWYNTPDNPDSPHGQYEPTMKAMLAKRGARFTDWWWLGVRNRAQGLAYALKPRYFKELTSYEGLDIFCSQKGNSRRIRVGEFVEHAWDFGWFHVIAGWRLSPIFDEVVKNRDGANIPFRPINMDARPILSIRGGALD